MEGFTGSQAKRFLELLGKQPTQVWMRAFKPNRKGAAEHYGITTREDRAWIDSKTADGFNLYAVIGEASSATGKGGGVQDADITGCPALFVEWDDGASIDEQVQRWQSLGLPEPTVMVATGGKSVHCYWALLEPISAADWKRITARLIAHCNSDKQCSNPSRVMRLPGSVYYHKKTGEASGQCRIIAAAGHRYSAADVKACLPIPKPPAKPATAPPSRDWEPRSIDEINAAAEYIPRREPGNGTYPEDRNALCGCAAALAEAGHPDPDGGALALLGHLWPSEAEARQVLDSTTTRKANSFWAIAGEHGYSLKRTTKAKTVTSGSSRQQQQRKASKPRNLSHTRRMACFDRCVEVQAQRERNSLRRRARLLKAAKDLGLAAFINRQEISQKVLEAKARCGGEGFKPLTAADRAAMPKPVVRWLVRGLIPANDLTIIGGRPKVGKTRVAVAIVAAVLRGEPFLEFSAPASSPPVLLVTDDQSAGDTADMLTALDLWTHPRLVTSEHFRLTETDLDALLEAIKANPGALVVLDSLRSISRALQHGENDPEIGATLYDLKQAVVDAGGTLLLIHHCNKAADLVGVEALSGHGAIAGAANTVITLHHCPNDKGLPDKINPQRRLFSQGRSGEDCDLVIDRGAGAGTYRQVSTFDHWQQQLSEAKKNQKLERLTELQQQALNALSDSGQWMTRRQVCEALGVTWTERGRSGQARKVGDSLHRLVELEEVESQRAGTEATFRASCETQKDTVTTVPINDTKGSQCHEPPRDNRDNRDMSRVSRTPRDTENACDDSLARLSRTSQHHPDPQERAAIEARIRVLGRSDDLSDWSDGDLAALAQSLELAATRRAAAGLMAMAEVA